MDKEEAIERIKQLRAEIGDVVAQYRDDTGQQIVRCDISILATGRNYVRTTLDAMPSHPIVLQLEEELNNSGEEGD